MTEVPVNSEYKTGVDIDWLNVGQNANNGSVNYTDKPTKIPTQNGFSAKSATELAAGALGTAASIITISTLLRPKKPYVSLKDKPDGTRSALKQFMTDIGQYDDSCNTNADYLILANNFRG